MVTQIRSEWSEVALLNLMDYEDDVQRSRTETTVSTFTFARVYNLPSGGNSLIPVRGDVLLLRTDDPMYPGDTHTTDILAPRVRDSPAVRKNQAGELRVVVSAYKIRPYA